MYQQVILLKNTDNGKVIDQSKMSYIETYNKSILDAVSIGKSINNFDENFGDYIKVEVLTQDDKTIGTLYSNRLLLKYPGEDSYHIGPYHYHQNTDGEMTFCSGKFHINPVGNLPSSITNLEPVPITNTVIGDEKMDHTITYRKQFQIFRDDSGRLYIKPNDIISRLKVGKGKYKLRIHFLRNTKSILGNFLKIMESNLIENGNFFAGLEATQAGDIDRSIGKNSFTRISNPGFSPFALEQNGLPNNQYIMKVTGIKPSANYIFSCWVAWDEQYNGDSHIVSFSGVYKAPESNIAENDTSDYDTSEGFNTLPKTDLKGSYIDDEMDRILGVKEAGGLKWYRLYAFVSTNENSNTKHMYIHLGKEGNDLLPSMNPLGKRFFTDLRLVRILNFDKPNVMEYINLLKSEVDFSDALKYTNVKSKVASPIKEEEVVEDIYVAPIPEESQEILDTINAVNVEDILSGTFGTDSMAGEDLTQAEQFIKGGKIKGNKSK